MDPPVTDPTPVPPVDVPPVDEPPVTEPTPVPPVDVPPVDQPPVTEPTPVPPVDVPPVDQPPVTDPTPVPPVDVPPAVDPTPVPSTPVDGPVVVIPVEPTPELPNPPVLVPPKPAQTAQPDTIGMLSAGADAQVLEATTLATDALASVSEWSSSTTRPTKDGGGDVVTPRTHLEDSASAPVGLSAAGSTHNTSVAAGASGSVTCGGASASVLGLLESIFGPDSGRNGDLGPLTTVQDLAWRLVRQPGFAPD